MRKYGGPAASKLVSTTPPPVREKAKYHLKSYYHKTKAYTLNPKPRSANPKALNLKPTERPLPRRGKLLCSSELAPPDAPRSLGLHLQRPKSLRV